MTYGLKIAIAFDQLCNTLAGGLPDETLSARAERWHLTGKRSWPKRLINALFFLQADHCAAAFQSELARRHLPDIYRGREVRT